MTRTPCPQGCGGYLVYQGITGAVCSSPARRCQNGEDTTTVTALYCTHCGVQLIVPHSQELGRCLKCREGTYDVLEDLF